MKNKFNEAKKITHLKSCKQRPRIRILVSEFSLIDLCHLNWILVKIKCHVSPGKMSRKN